MNYLVLLYLLFLWKYSDTHIVWLVFTAIMSILVEAGVSTNILKLAIAIGIWKVMRVAFENYTTTLQ